VDFSGLRALDSNSVENGKNERMFCNFIPRQSIGMGSGPQARSNAAEQCAKTGLNGFSFGSAAIRP
jgi:hypothetical protein